MEIIVDNVVSMILQGAVNFVKMYIEEMGLGHWAIESWQLEQNSEIPEIFNYNAFLENFLFTGASDFIVHNLKFSSESSKLYFDVSIPALKLSIGKLGGTIKLLGNGFDGEVKGKINIIEPRIIGELSLNISQDFSFTLNHVDAKFLLKSIKSNLKVKINNTSHAKLVNDFLSKSVPAFIARNNAQVNELLNHIIKSATKRSSNSVIDNLF